MKDGKLFDWRKEFPNKTYYDEEVYLKGKELGYAWDGSFCNVHLLDATTVDKTKYNFNSLINSPLADFMHDGPGNTPIDIFQNNLIEGANTGKDGVQYWADPKQGYDAARREGLLFISVSAQEGVIHTAGIDILRRWSKYEGGTVIQAGAMNGIYPLSNRNIYGSNWNNTQKVLPKSLSDPTGWAKDNHVYYYTLPYRRR